MIGTTVRPVCVHGARPFCLGLMWHVLHGEDATVVGTVRVGVRSRPRFRALGRPPAGRTACTWGTDNVTLVWETD